MCTKNIAITGITFMTLTATSLGFCASTPTDQSEEALYQQAVMNCAMHTLLPSHLFVMPVGRQRFIEVATWTHKTYTLGMQTLSHNVWIIDEHSMHAVCKGFSQSRVALNIEQLLGMPPLPHYQGWHFIVMSVPVEQANTATSLMSISSSGLFRPCISTSAITSPTCSYQPNHHAGQYNAWLLNLSQEQFRTTHGYPWTGLGYTYNWNPAAKSVVGLSEFIVTRGTPVDVLHIQSPQQLCFSSI